MGSITWWCFIVSLVVSSWHYRKGFEAASKAAFKGGWASVRLFRGVFLIDFKNMSPKQITEFKSAWKHWAKPDTNADPVVLNDADLM